MSLTVILVAGGVLAVIMLIIGVVISAREERSLVEERLGRYIEDEKDKKAAQSGDRSGPLTDWLNTTATQFSWGEKIARDLARADMKFKVGEYLALIVIVASTAAIIVYMVGGRSPLTAVGAGVVASFIPGIYVKMQQGKRLQRFNDQLADMLNLMVNGLRAGYSTMQAMEAVSKELPPPICDEFRRVVQEMQLGVPMEKALDNLLRRIPSPDLDLVVTAINIQREVGGNLAEILDTISHTIRERVKIKGEIKVLTSQVMISGQFLSVIPFLLLLAMYGLNRSYMMYFFDPDWRIIGIPALIAVFVLIGAGYFVMTRIAAIEV